MNKSVIAAIAAGALVIAGGIGITAATAASAPDLERAVAVEADVEKVASVVEPIAEPTTEPTVEPVPVVEQPAPAPAPAAPAPIRCPAGSTANSSDGVNDTSCFPTVCFTLTLPDPAYPECDVAFRP